MSMSSAISSIASALPLPWEGTPPRRADRSPAWVVDVMSREGEAITRMLWRLLGQEADVLDAFQDTFCHLALRGAAVDPRSARAYAFRTATNIGIELIRSRKLWERHREAIATQHAQKTEIDTPVGEGGRPMPVCHDRLRQALGGLPPHLRSVIVLRDLACLSYEEISGILQIGAATARVYRRHAIVRLGELMNGEPRS